MDNKIYWHYTSINAFNNILKSKKLWFGSSLTMDDPLDRFCGPQYALEFLFNDALIMKNDLGIDYEFDLTYIPKIFEMIQDVAIYTLSFDLNNDNNVLWEMYADHYKGVSIGFDLDYLKQNISKIKNEIDSEDFCNEPSIEIKAVHYGYDAKELKNDFFKCKQEFEYTYNSNLSSNFPLFASYFCYLQNSKYKSAIWNKQNEYRLIYQQFPNVYLKTSDIKSNDWLGMLKRHELRFQRKILKALGLTHINKHKKKNYLSLNVADFFNSNLIKSVVIKNKNVENDIRKVLNKNGLNETSIIILEN